MIGIIVQLLLSWLLIWFFEKKNLAVLGLKPTKKRVLDFAVFFLVTAFFAASGFLMSMYFGQRWALNPAFTATLLLEGLWWNIKSVLFEELIFRGVIFYILIRRLGVTKAIIISAIAFGIYHWFSFGVFGDPQKMAIIFLITGLAGVMYAYGYAKTASLYVPCAIHLGWNFTRNFIFSGGNIGEGLLVDDKPAFTVTVSHFVYYFISYFPMIGALVVNCLILRKYKNDNA